MRKLIKKLINKNIIKILTIFIKDKEKCLFTETNYLDDKIYFETQHLIRLLKEKYKGG